MDRLQIELQTARQNFADGVPLPIGLLPDPIARSWERSRAAGLSPWQPRLARGRLDILPLTDADTHLAECVQPELERLWELIGDSHWMLFCVNPENRIVQTRKPAGIDGPLSALHAGRRVGEVDVGTTAPACTLVDGLPAIVAGNQHYLQEFSQFFCVSVPLRGVGGELLGALDLTGIGTRNAGTMLERLKHAALATENNFFLALADCRILELQHDPRLMGSPLQALLAVREDGTVCGANRAAQQLLGIASYRPHGLNLEHLFDRGSHGQLNAASKLLTLTDGSRLYARLLDQPLSKSLPIRAARCALGSDRRVNARFEDAKKAVVANLAVLITGPTGCGKEVFARELHRQCTPNAPFVAINCASLPESLIESELFGYAEGSFTGARKGGSMGLLESAGNGILLLDEIGDMPFALQSRLLRVLQERQITRVGSTVTVPLKAHIIAATHKSLPALVASGGFREDLFYRLDGMRIALPSLNQRLDKEQLVDAFFQRPGMPMLDAEARAIVHAYDWPGNLRQLENVAAVVAILAVGACAITVNHLPEEVRGTAAVAPRSLSAATRDVIERTLLAHAGNVTAAAKELGISRTTLYKRLSGR
ncbi:sigma-54-dependent Fis family transcriptional regulator [Pseudomonas sp. P66]|jgi:transcriptional regulator of acetoin/glycerol metabolism|uniref:Sigma-54-dependent Fis family transcriptional regulator n=1 Tax=Pseudomonas arcuscaelestis TaxID=2710591 RepID=A0ABS2C4P5_9PSED|nr:sigma 54-interacting transcriptional regulator [Pseudomonas arcuscaelestis]MBM5460831.1 sigma-54-dependent Fis family transcriptional regulator [Pseudomonas arcuscaelestis]